MRTFDLAIQGKLKKMMTLLLMLVAGCFVNDAWAVDYVHVMLGAADGSGRRPVTAKFVRTDRNNNGRLEDSQISPLVKTHRYWKAEAATDNGDGTYTLDESAGNEITTGNHFPTETDYVCYVTYDDYDARLFHGVYRIFVRWENNYDQHRYLWARTGGIYQSGDGSYDKADLWTLTGDPYCAQFHPYSKPGESISIVNDDNTDAFDGFARLFSEDANKKYNKFSLVTNGSNLSSRVNQYLADGTIMVSGEGDAISQYLNWPAGGNPLKTWRGRGDGQTFFIQTIPDEDYRRYHFMDGGEAVAMYETTSNLNLTLPRFVQSPLCSNYRLWADEAMTQPLPTPERNCLMTAVPDVYVSYDYDASVFDGTKDYFVQLKMNGTKPYYIGASDANNRLSHTINQNEASVWRVSGSPYRFRVLSPDGTKFVSAAGMENNLTEIYGDVSNHGYDYFSACFSSESVGRFSLFINPGTDESMVYSSRSAIGVTNTDYSQPLKVETAAYNNINGWGDWTASFILANTVKYHIVTLDSTKVAITATREAGVDPAGLPDYMKSPLASNFRYWQTGTWNGSTWTLSDEVTSDIEAGTVPSGVKDIYVTYSYDATPAVGTFDLTGGTAYQMKGTTSYVYNNGTGNAVRLSTSTPKRDIFMWLLSGSDPYDIKITSKQDPTYMLSKRDKAPHSNNINLDESDNAAYIQRFILLQHPGLETYELMAACTPTQNPEEYFYLQQSGDYLYLKAMADGQTGADKVQMTLTPYRRYHIIRNDAGDEAINAQLPDDGVVPLVPAAIRTPLLREADYTYYATLADAKARTNPISESRGHLDVYVRYDYSPANNPTGIDISGGTYYAIHYPDRSNAYLHSRGYDPGKSDYRLTMNGDAGTRPYKQQRDWFMWYFDGADDPYWIAIGNAYKPGELLGKRDKTAYSHNGNGSIENSYMDAPNDAYIQHFFISQDPNCPETYQITGAHALTDSDEGLLFYVHHGNGNDWMYTEAHPDVQTGVARAQLQLDAYKGYHVVDNDGEIAVQAYVQPTGDHNAQIPQVLYSPLVSGYTYHPDQTAAEAGTGAFTTEDGHRDIYVRYTFDNATSPLDLNGTTWYNWQFLGGGTRYAYDRGDNNNIYIENNPSAITRQRDTYQWRLTGNDPYRVRLQSKAYPSLYVSKIDRNRSGNTDMRTRTEDTAGTMIQTFSITQAEGKTSYQLMGSYSPTEFDNDTYTHYYARYNGNQWAYIQANPTYTDGHDWIQMDFTATRTYHVVDLSGNEVIEYTTTSSTLQVPEPIRSPLATNWTFYGSLSDAQSKTNAITTSVGHLDIYARYEYDNAASPVNLQGGSWYALHYPNVESGARYAYNYRESDTERQVLANRNVNDNPRFLLQEIFQWKLTGGDPYRVTITNMLSPTLVLGKRNQNVNSDNGCRLSAPGTSGYIQEFIITQNPSNPTTYEFMATTQPTGDNKGLYFYLQYDGNWSQIYATSGRQTGVANLQIELVPYQYYHIIANDAEHTEAVQRLAPASSTLAVPSVIKSPLLTDAAYVYYGSREDAVSQTNPLATATGYSDIYVRYTYDNSASPIDLQGGTSYIWNMTGNTRYHYANNDIDARTYLVNGLTEQRKQSDRFLWQFTGNDPYFITVQNKARDGRVLAAETALTTCEADQSLYMREAASVTTPSHFILTKADGKDTYQLIASGCKIATDDSYREYRMEWLYYVRSNGNDYPYITARENYQNGENYVQHQFIPYRTYHVIDLSGDEAIHYTVPADDNTLRLPSVIKSVQVPWENFTYYPTAEDAVNGTNPITTGKSKGHSDIYVGYTFDNTTSPIDLSGNTWYTIKFHNGEESQNGRMLYSRGNYTQSGENRPWLSREAVGLELQNDIYKWAFTGNDPYRIEVENKAQPGYVYARNNKTRSNSSEPLLYASDPATHLQRFILTQAEGKTTYQMMGAFLATEEDASSGPFYYWRNDNRDQPYITGDPSYQDGHDYCQLHIDTWQLFHIVNKQQKIALSAYFPYAPTLAMSDELKSPLIPDDEAHYKFFNSAEDAFAWTMNPTDEVAAAHNAITQMSEVTGEDIYVGYKYVAAEAPAGSPDLSGGSWYTIYYQNGDKKYYAQQNLTNENQTRWSYTTTPSTHPGQLTSFLWKFEGDDPYGFRLINYAKGENLAFGNTTDWRLNGSFTGANNRFFIKKDAGGKWNIGATDIKTTAGIGEIDYIYWLGTDENNANIRLTRNNEKSNNRYLSDRGYCDLIIDGLPEQTYTFHIITNDYKQALVMEVDLRPAMSCIDQMPDILKSPAATDYTFWTEWTEGNAPTRQTTTTPLSNDIYVRYSTNPHYGLDGKTIYNVKSNGLYAYAASSYIRLNSSLGENATFGWYLDGGDPYAVRLRVAGDADRYLGAVSTSLESTQMQLYGSGSSNVLSFAIFNGSEVAGNVTLAVTDNVDLTDLKELTLPYIGRTDDTYLRLLRRSITPSTAGVQIQLVKQISGHVLHVINRQGQEVFTYLDETAMGDSYTPALPDYLKGLGAMNFTYYRHSDFDEARANTGLFVLTEGEHTPITSLTPATNVTDIYVMYEVDKTALRSVLGKLYNVKLRDTRYLTCDGATGGVGTAATLSDATALGNLWRFVSTTTDPYDIQLYSATDRNMLLGAADYGDAPSLAANHTLKTFILTQAGAGSMGYELLLVNSATDGSKPFGYLALDGNQVKLLRDDRVQHTTATSNPVAFSLTAQSLPYVYKLYDLSGRLSLVGIEEHPADLTPCLPEFMQSPFVKEYCYWQEEDGLNILTSLTDAEVVDGQRVIYVTYEPLPVEEMPWKLDGSEYYVLHGLTNPEAILGPSMGGSQEWWPHVNLNYREGNYYLSLYGRERKGGFDPYDVAVLGNANGQYWKTDLVNQTKSDNLSSIISEKVAPEDRFMFLQGAEERSLEIMRKKLVGEVNHPEWADRYQYLFLNANSSRLSTGQHFNQTTKQNQTTYQHLNDNVQFVLQRPYVYHILNLRGTEATTFVETRIVEAGGVAPAVPDIVLSPLVRKYHFWDSSAFEEKDGSYSLKPDAQEIARVADAASHEIFVTYAKSDISNEIDLTGQRVYRMTTSHNGDWNNSNKIYRVGQKVWKYDKANNRILGIDKADFDGFHEEDKIAQEYLFRFGGGDPYDVKVYTEVKPGVSMSNGATAGNGVMQLNFSEKEGFIHNYMLLKGAMPEADSAGWKYRLGSAHLATPGFRYMWFQYQHIGLTANERDGNRQYIAWVVRDGYHGGAYNYESNHNIQLRIEEPLQEATFTYVVINKQGEEAIRMSVKGNVGITPELPSAIRSAYATGYHYYTEQTGGVEITQDNADRYMTDGRVIYVRDYAYTGDTSVLSVAEGEYYNIQANNSYLYDRNGILSGEVAPEHYNDDYHEWRIVANRSGNLDPYDVHIESKSSAGKWIEGLAYDGGKTVNNLSLTASGSANIGSFILMKGRGDRYEFLAATGAVADASADGEIRTRLSYLGFDGEPALLGMDSKEEEPLYQSGVAAVQLRITKPLSGITYHVMNLSGKEAVRFTEYDIKDDVPELPVQLRSPFATNYRYWTSAACDLEMASIPRDNTDIYVTYDYDDATTGALRLDGSRYYNMQVGGWYVSEDATSALQATEESLTTEEANSEAYLWSLDGTQGGNGIDPYDLHLANKSVSTIYAGGDMNYGEDTEVPMQLDGGDNFRDAYILVGTSVEGPYELLLASGYGIADNVMAYVTRADDEVVNLSRTGELQSGHHALAVELTPPRNTYVYKIRNKSGDIVIQAEGDGQPGDVPMVPSFIASPLVKTFYYDVDELPYETTTIEVTYDVDEEKMEALNLNGEKNFNIKFSDNYFAKATGDAVEAVASTATNLGDPTVSEDSNIWHPKINNSDPYDVTILHSNGLIVSSASVASGRSALTFGDASSAAAYKTFILLAGAEEDRYQLMVATGEEDMQNQFAYFGQGSDHKVYVMRGDAYTQDKSGIQVEFVPFRYQYTYIVLNNDRKEAVRYSVVQSAGDKVRIPEPIRSPLIADEEYVYYLESAFVAPIGNWETEKKFDEGKKVEQTLLPYSSQTYYVRYTYAPKVGGLDLQGTIRYNLYGTSNNNGLYAKNDNSVGSNTLNGTNNTQSQYLWYFTGDDPYNVVIHSESQSEQVIWAMNTWLPYNGVYWYDGKWYNYEYKKSDTEKAVKQSFGIQTHKMDYVSGDGKGNSFSTYSFAFLGHADGNYRMMAIAPWRWDDEWKENHKATTDKGSENKYGNNYVVVTSAWGIGDQTNDPAAGVSLTFAPVTKRNYRFHLKTKIDERDIVVEKPEAAAYDVFDLPEELKRKYCTYKFTYYVDNVTGMPVPRKEDGSAPENATAYDGLEIGMNPQRYHPYPYFEVIDTRTAEEQAKIWIDIYVDYTVEDDEIPFHRMASTKETTHGLFSNKAYLDAIFDLTTYEKRTEVVHVSSTQELRRCDYLYFMVMKTDNEFTNDNGQYFLRREDSGRISWLNGDFKIYPDGRGETGRYGDDTKPSRNYAMWDYSRCAEAYRANDHAPFEEKRWLWCFAGDPYDLYIFNVNSVLEETYNEFTYETEVVAHRDHLVGQTRLTNLDGTTKEYLVNTPSYTEEAPELYRWGLAMGQGSDSDKTFSLITGEFTPDGLQYRNPMQPTTPEHTPLYWKMETSASGGSSRVMLLPRDAQNTTLDYNIRVLPYEPCKFEDVRFLIRRDDDVAAYINDNSTSAFQRSTSGERMAQLREIDGKTSGTVRMYSALDDRMYVKGDVITESRLPQELRRQFCDYRLYTDDYRTMEPFTVDYSPIRGEQQTRPDGVPIYNVEGMPVYKYYAVDENGNLFFNESGNNVETAPQTVFVWYKVTSDIFLKKAPSQEEVKEMAKTNDHVFFIDFPDTDLLKGKEEAYNTGHHVYFDEEATFEKQVDKLREDVLSERMAWNEAKGEFDYVDKDLYNKCQYRTTENRMETVPENLKWYFVGDPYAVQVYCTAGEWGDDGNGNIVGANLCRIEPVETKYQFVTDCVHLRVPDNNVIDRRATIQFYNEKGKKTEEVANPNRGKAYLKDFFWEVVPAMSESPDAFALRFRADNTALNYRNVYYYLAHDGLKRDYREGVKENRKGMYYINLSYDPDNTPRKSGTYQDYHIANNSQCIIRLIQPARVYVSAYKNDYSGSAVVENELSEYFGVGEKLTEVPRHLQRKFVKYGNLQYQPKDGGWLDASFDFDLNRTDHYNRMEECVKHPIGEKTSVPEYDKVYVAGAQTNAEYKLRVVYTVDDVTNPTAPASQQIHLFTTSLDDPVWLDVEMGGNSWLYYDKLVRDDDGAENHTERASKFDKENDSGYGEVTGWNTGLKGLHWAFVGDPYNFTALNRRRWEDAEWPTADPTDENIWLGTGYGQMQETVNGESKLVDYNYAQLGKTSGNTGLGSTTANGNTTWSLQYCKTGGSNDYFIRTATPLHENGTSCDSEEDPTNAYSYLVKKGFQETGNSENQSAFVTKPFSLETATRDIPKTTIHTVVAQDHDGADNDCFDANVYIYNLKGERKAALKRIELTYGEVFSSMPKTLRRYGCTYIQCYLNDYGQQTEGGGEPLLIADINVTDNSLPGIFDDATLALGKKVTISDRKYTEVSYVYTFDEEVAKFFTTLNDASQDEYTWVNAYYRWEEPIPGDKMTYVDYDHKVFDHYVYNADGHVIDEVYRYDPIIKERDGSPSSKPFYGWVNTHTGSERAYGNETAQSEEDAQKWSFIGDPYDFELKNYSKFLQNDKSALIGQEKDDTPVNFDLSQASHWAIMQGKQQTHINDEGKVVNVVDDAGNPVYEYYLALIDDDPDSDTYGAAIKLITFDREEGCTAADQYLYATGGVKKYDPTGRLYDAEGVKPFYLSDLMSYANIVVYHLVIAHQYSREAEDKDALAGLGRWDKKIWEGINNGEYREVDYNVMDHLAEWDWYNNRQVGRSHDDYPLSEAEVTGLGNKYVKPSSLRDVIQDPIRDYSVQRVGIGNRLSVPWYMKRQFCNYDLYQRDVMKSVTLDGSGGLAGDVPVYAYLKDSDGNYVLDENNQRIQLYLDDEKTQPAYEVKWVSVLKTWNKDTDSEGNKPTGYDAISEQNSHLITRLDGSHRNRMVVIDVVYHVNPEEFRFADKGRNTTAWYSMLTNNAKDGLMNFSYKDGIGARHGREAHYTNNYLWAPEGDPYGFVLRSRYATINGTGWDNVVVTTTGQLPTAEDVANGTLAEYDLNKMTTVGKDTKEGTDDVFTVQTGSRAIDLATYTGAISNARFVDKRICHYGRGSKRTDGSIVRTWAARNAVYEMFAGEYEQSFLMHPTSAYVDIAGDRFSSFYMVHNTNRGSDDFHRAELRYVSDAKTIRSNPDANWRLFTTPEQLLPYFERSGYVGGLVPLLAKNFENESLYNKLKEYKDTYQATPSVIDFATIDRARELVYKGKFYARQKDGGYETEEYLYTQPRPADNRSNTALPEKERTDDTYKLPLKFVSDNLVPLQQGYYRIQAFSRKALDADGADVDGTGVEGIRGPRYISGYRHQSEKDYEGFDDDNNLKPGSRWLHFYETDEEHTTLKNFQNLDDTIATLGSKNYHNRDIAPHPAMRGNIEILPAEYDPSSIFYFAPVAPKAGEQLDRFERYHFGTQGLWVRGRAGGVQGIDYEYGESEEESANKYGVTKLVDTPSGRGADLDADEATALSEAGHGIFDDRFRIADIGGTAVTFRILEKESDNWDDIVDDNLKTNYLCIDANHRYRITIHKDNEMKEIGDNYDHLTDEQYWNLPDINYGIQDTKWLLQPVGVQTQWPYNQMPLRVRVNEGGQKPDTQTGKGLPEDIGIDGVDRNKDQNYYASLYVPFDARLSSTIDAAFTCTVKEPSPKTIRLSSVSQLNNMGNPQFIPAGWPVVIRSGKPSTTITLEDGGVRTVAPYVDLYLPSSQPTRIPENFAKINLHGEYLEKILPKDSVNAKLSAVGRDEITSQANQNIMVLGLPFVEKGDKTTYGEKGSEKSADYYSYVTNDAVGFYTNENWRRDQHTGMGLSSLSVENDEITAKENTGDFITSHLATARNATYGQRDNKYVYHNKVYYIYDQTDKPDGERRDELAPGTGGVSVKPYYALLFDDEDELRQPQTDDETPLPDVPHWGVYDLSGRLLRTKEAILNGTWRRNLPPGMYIVNGRKVPLK